MRIEQHRVGLLFQQLVAVDSGLPAERGPLVDLHFRAVATLDLAPHRVGLGEEDVRVEREDARLRVEREQHVEQHRLLFLERAGERHTTGESVEERAEDLLRGHRLVVELR